MLADPRIRVLAVALPYLKEVTDSAGNVLLKQEISVGFQNVVGIENCWWDQSCAFPLPDKPGEKLASVKGESRLRVQSQGGTITIDDPQKHVGETFAVAGSHFELIEFKPIENTGLNISLAQKDPPEAPLPFEIEITDKSGNIVWQHYYTSFVEPLIPISTTDFANLKINVISKTRDITIPFELKDLPYPH